MRTTVFSFVVSGQETRRMMINYKSIFLFVLMSMMLFYSGQKLCFAQKDGDDIVIGKYKTIHSHILDEDRLLFVHLPREYGDTKRYPGWIKKISSDKIRS